MAAATLKVFIIPGILGAGKFAIRIERRRLNLLKLYHPAVREKNGLGIKLTVSLSCQSTSKINRVAFVSRNLFVGTVSQNTFPVL